MTSLKHILQCVVLINNTDKNKKTSNLSAVTKQHEKVLDISLLSSHHSENGKQISKTAEIVNTAQQHNGSPDNGQCKE